MDAFLHIGFTHHRIILGKVKEIDERLFYIRRCASGPLTVDALKESISADDYHHQGNLPNNFIGFDGVSAATRTVPVHPSLDKTMRNRMIYYLKFVKI